RVGGWIELDFPALPPQPATSPVLLNEALGIAPVYVGVSRFDFLLEVVDEETLRQMKPDFGLLAKVPVRGIIVTSQASSPPYDFVSRFFAPSAGVPEDPATGSAHCCLVPFWHARLGKTEFLAYQASARGGIVRAELKGDRVLLAGQAVTVWRG